MVQFLCFVRRRVMKFDLKEKNVVNKVGKSTMRDILLRMYKHQTPIDVQIRLIWVLIALVPDLCILFNFAIICFILWRLIV